MSSHGQYLDRLDRQSRCVHWWGEWRPMPDSPAGLWMRTCRKCWLDQAASKEEIGLDWVTSKSTSKSTATS